MDRLEELKAKYAAVIALCKEQNVILQHVHLENNKLFVRGNAPNENIKNNVWNAVKAVDASFADLDCEIGIDSSIPLPASKYTVKPGDSLSKIAKHFYGDPMKYTVIFEANKDQIKNPDLIHPGQELIIPPQ